MLLNWILLFLIYANIDVFGYFTSNIPSYELVFDSHSHPNLIIVASFISLELLTFFRLGIFGMSTLVNIRQLLDIYHVTLFHHSFPYTLYTHHEVELNSDDSLDRHIIEIPNAYDYEFYCRSHWPIQIENSNSPLVSNYQYMRHYSIDNATPIYRNTFLCNNTTISDVACTQSFNEEAAVVYSNLYARWINGMDVWWLLFYYSNSIEMQTLNIDVDIEVMRYKWIHYSSSIRWYHFIPDYSKFHLETCGDKTWCVKVYGQSFGGATLGHWRRHYSLKLSHEGNRCFHY